MVYRAWFVNQRRVRSLSCLPIDNLVAAICAAWLLPSVVFAQTIPQTGLRLWLRADQGAMQDKNGNLTSWQDQSGNRDREHQTQYRRLYQCAAPGPKRTPVSYRRWK